MKKNQTLGEIIKYNRIKKNWSKTYLADELNVSVTAISMYEQNERVPADDKKRILCNLFNISFDELMGASNDVLLTLEIEKILQSFYFNEKNFNIIKEELLLCFDFSKEDLLLKRKYITNDKDIVLALNTIIISVLNFLKHSTETNPNIIHNNRLSTDKIHRLQLIISKEEEQTILNAINNLTFKEVSRSCTIQILDSNQNVYDYIEIIGNKENYISFHIEDDSMVCRYQPDDIIILAKTDKAKNGDDVLISIENKLYLRKIFYMPNNGILLQPYNPSYDLINLTKLDIEKKNFKVLGIPTEIKLNTK